MQHYEKSIKQYWAAGAAVGLAVCVLSMRKAWVGIPALKRKTLNKVQIVYFIPDLNGNTPHFQIPREIFKRL